MNNSKLKRDESILKRFPGCNRSFFVSQLILIAILGIWLSGEIHTWLNNSHRNRAYLVQIIASVGSLYIAISLCIYFYIAFLEKVRIGEKRFGDAMMQYIGCCAGLNILPYFLMMIASAVGARLGLSLYSGDSGFLILIFTLVMAVFSILALLIFWGVASQLSKEKIE